MKHKAILMIISVLMLCAFIANVAAFAGAEDIKKRMKARLSTIVSLKNQGIIGESNEGYIVYMGNARPQQDVINAENSDRNSCMRPSPINRVQQRMLSENAGPYKSPKKQTRENGSRTPTGIGIKNNGYRTDQHKGCMP